MSSLVKALPGHHQYVPGRWSAPMANGHSAFAWVRAAVSSAPCDPEAINESSSRRPAVQECLFRSFMLTDRQLLFWDATATPDLTRGG